MAIFRVGGVASDVRGSIGGQTYSRNRTGAYIRNRTVPVNPGSSEQSAVRALVSQLSNAWVTVLTAAQRAAWDAYADAVHLPNSLGELRNVGGIGMYIRGNVGRLQTQASELARVDDGPLDLTVGDYSPPDLNLASEAAQTFGVVFDNTDAWANETGSAMLIYASRPKNESVNYFKGPYRYAGKILGDDTTPPTSPATINAPFPFTEDQKLFFRVNVTRDDGRLGAEFRHSTLAVA